MKNAFYFIWKALFVLKMFTFLCWLFRHVEKTASSERWGYFKFYDVTAWLRTITIHILSNVSGSKGNHTMKFGQAIEYDKRILFLEKSCRKYDR